MGRVEAETRPKIATAPGAWIRHIDWFLLLRRALLVLCLADVVVAESQLSELVKSGHGADHTAASPTVVALLLIASLSAAVLLRWQSVYGGTVGVWWSLARLRQLPDALRRLPHAVWAASSRLLPRRGALQALLARWQGAARTMTWRHWAGLSLAWIALVSALVASALASATAPVLAAQWFWIAGIILLLIAAGVWPSAHASPLQRLRWRLASGASASYSSRSSRWRTVWTRYGDWLLMAALLGVGAGLRLPNLTAMPYVIHGDEASCALEALRWLNGEVHTLLSTGWYGLPVAGYGIPALVMRFAGDDLFGLRLSSVLVGLLSLALMYLLAREFAGRRVAFVATALLTFSHLHIQFSRSGIHYIHALCAAELALWLLVRALRDRSAVAAVLAAVAMSLCAQVYFSARLVFIIVPLFIAGLWLLNRHLLRGRAPALAWLVAGLLAALGPLAAYFRMAGDTLNSRTNEVLIFNQTPWMRGHLIEQFGTADLPTVLVRQLAAVPLIPTAVADQSTQYGPHYSLLDISVATLVTIGFFYALLRLRQPVYLLLTIWIAGTVVFGGILTIDMPDWQRLLVMLPALCLLAALLLEDILHRVEWGIVTLADWLPSPRLLSLSGLSSLMPTLATTLLALALLGLSASWNIQRYFVDYPHQTNQDSWWTTYTDIGRYLGTLPTGTHFILFSDSGLVADYATLRYLGPGATGSRVETMDELTRALAGSTGPTVTIVTLSRAAEVEQALAADTKLPLGVLTPYVTANHTTTFYLFTLTEQPAGSTPGTGDAP